jgi:hemerythrin
MPRRPLAPSLLLGVPQIDKEHQALLDTFHRLIDGVPSDPASERFSEVMGRLGTQLADHFSNEERLIRSCGMPDEDVDEHLMAHTEILEQYAQIQLDLMSGQAVDSMATFRMIEGWFIDHVATHDLKLKQWLPAA